MILDNLFAQAAQDYTPEPGLSITVACTVTSNQTGGFESQNTNKASAAAPVILSYAPGSKKLVKEPDGHESVEVIAASFDSGGKSPITISAPKITPGSYEIGLLGTRFAAQADPTTNIVFGAAGSAFVTLSLCGYGKSVNA